MINLTYKQADLLLNMVNACITRAVQSGIPIGKEYYTDIDEIKKKLYDERYSLYNKQGTIFEGK